MADPRTEIARLQRILSELADNPSSVVYQAAERELAKLRAVGGFAAETASRPGEVASQAGRVLGAAQAREDAETAAQQARQIRTTFATPPRDSNEAAARVRALRSGREAVQTNPNIPIELREQVDILLGEAEAAGEALRNQQQRQAEFSGSVVGRDDQVDVVAGRPVGEAAVEAVPTVREVQAPQNVPPRTLQRDFVTQLPSDPRGTVDASTVAGTPRPRGTRAAAPATPAAPPPKGAPYQDPYDPGSLYTDTGPVSEIRRSFGEQGKIEQQAGLDSAADVMAAAEQIRAQKDAAYQRMREDLVSQDRMLRELDVQLGQLRSMQFDGERLFRNGHGVSLALGIAVGAMQQTLNNVLFPGSNAPNTAMALVNDAIERDLQEQSVNFQQGVTTLGMGRTAYSMARELGMDHVAAYEYAAASAQDYVARQLNARRLTMGAGVAAQQALRAEQELRMSAMDRREDALMMGAQQMVARQGGGGRSAAASGSRFVDGPFPRAAWTPRAQGMSGSDVRKIIGDGTWNDIRGVTNGGDRVLSLIGRMRSILNSGAGDEYLSRVRGELESLSGQLTGALKDSLELGALDNGVERLKNSIVMDPTSLGGTNLWKQRILGQMEALTSETLRVVESYVELNGQGYIRYDPNRVVQLREQPEIPGATYDERDQPPTPPPGPFAASWEAITENPRRSFEAVLSPEQRRGLRVIESALTSVPSGGTILE